MGWFDTWWNGGDHLKDVDPSLRKFLEQQQPRPYEPASHRSDQREPDRYREQVGLTEHVDPEAQWTAQQTQKPATKEDAPLPTESLFQDGRYKHLWKNYRPQKEIEEAGKSDQEKLLDIVHGFQERQAEVGRAAMENCSNQQWAVHECFRKGSWASKLLMCKEENRELNRCMDMQKRFLKALGYTTLANRPPEESERIQMHADRLYQQMLQQEKAINEARRNGLPEPEFDSLLPYDKDQRGNKDEMKMNKTASPTYTWDQLPEDMKEKFQETRLQGLEGAELEFAKRALEQDIALNADLVNRVSERYMIEHRERMQRIADGEERFSDKVKGWFDKRDYGDEQNKK